MGEPMTELMVLMVAAIVVLWVVLIALARVAGWHDEESLAPPDDGRRYVFRIDEASGLGAWVCDERMVVDGAARRGEGR